ncbi:unnamed protein product, partial [Clonostachys chloroleuca]
MGICDINIRGDQDPETSESGIDQGAASPFAEWASGFGITQGRFEKDNVLGYSMVVTSLPSAEALNTSVISIHVG